MLIGDPDDAVVFDFKPGIDAGAEMLGRRGEDQRFDEKRPAAQRRRAIDEAMDDRAEGETRADVARRLDQARASDGAGRPDVVRDRLRRTTRTQSRTEVTDARRVVVKVGSSSLTTAGGGIDPAPGPAAGRRARRPPAPAASRSCWSPPARSPPGWRRSG